MFATPMTPSAPAGLVYFAGDEEEDGNSDSDYDNGNDTNNGDSETDTMDILEIPIWPPQPPCFPPRPVVYASEFAALVAFAREKFSFVTPLNVYDLRFSRILLDLPEVTPGDVKPTSTTMRNNGVNASFSSNHNHDNRNKNKNKNKNKKNMNNNNNKYR